MPNTLRKKTANLLHEHQYYGYGYRMIVGLDEAGRGAWAGPVAAGAVCLPVADPGLSKILRGVNDSKQLSAKQRADLIEKVKVTAVAWGVGSASNQEIDVQGIVPATMLAMRRALDDLQARRPEFRPDVLFIDAMLLPDLPGLPQVSLIGGDARSLSIAAASIIAKVWRDAYMTALDEAFPGYHFADNKGYGGSEAYRNPHAMALKQHGPCAAHRMTFAPVIKAQQQDHKGNA